MIFGNDHRDKTEHPGPFAKFPAPPEPDYNRPEAWAAHPDHAPLSAWPAQVGAIPPGPGGALDAVQTFFIHPTTFRGLDVGWNAPWDDPTIAEMTDAWPMRHQASLFRSVGRVTAPRYRQAHLRTFFLRGADSHAALELAYSDVRRAFLRFLQSINRTTGIVIAGHSQGSYHGSRILQEFFDGTPLQARLIAAYLPGYPIPADSLIDIPFADRDAHVGAVHGWMTFAEGFTPEFHASHMQNVRMVHPILWTAEDGVWNHWGAHGGIVNRKFKLRHKHALSGALHEGMLWIKPLRVLGAALFAMKNWHVADYNLFWENIRLNLTRQVELFRFADLRNRELP